MRRVVVIGAGIGGLAAATELARQGLEVVVLERAAAAGGKMREITVGGARIDSGPTVLTLRWVFDELFARAAAVGTGRGTIHVVAAGARPVGLARRVRPHGLLGPAAAEVRAGKGYRPAAGGAGASQHRSA